MQHFHLNVYTFLPTSIDKDVFGFETKAEAIKEQSSLSYSFKCEGFIEAKISTSERIVLESQACFALCVAPSLVQAIVLEIETVSGEDCN